MLVTERSVEEAIDGENVPLTVRLPTTVTLPCVEMLPAGEVVALPLTAMACYLYRMGITIAFVNRMCQGVAGFVL